MGTPVIVSLRLVLFLQVRTPVGPRARSSLFLPIRRRFAFPFQTFFAVVHRALAAHLSLAVSSLPQSLFMCVLPSLTLDGNSPLLPLLHPLMTPGALTQRVITPYLTTRGRPFNQSLLLA